jgi:hypothetical protein
VDSRVGERDKRGQDDRVALTVFATQNGRQNRDRGTSEARCAVRLSEYRQGSRTQKRINGSSFVGSENNRNDKISSQG